MTFFRLWLRESFSANCSFRKNEIRDLVRNMSDSGPPGNSSNAPERPSESPGASALLLTISGGYNETHFRRGACSASVCPRSPRSDFCFGAGVFAGGARLTTCGWICILLW